MLLPGRLRTTTLGDLLGTIYRAHASGTLELTEDRGRSHRIHFTEGRVIAVEIDGASVPGIGLRQKLVQRLNVLEAIADAQVRFRVALRAPATKLNDPLDPADFLRGRRRARDASKTPPPASTRQVQPARQVSTERHAALHLLGLSQYADATSIKQAYRRLVRTYHPDLHPQATDSERRSLAQRFAAITQAYQRLVA
ncbi:DnaJ domain-containing protein [Pendulispora brunnea]|uniref:DnaJ domain-containing protein n=1 Tax=Pendulispora brunnea TaxID=2905690 RepID=A0ABZ2KP09_9BACT